MMIGILLLSEAGVWAIAFLAILILFYKKVLNPKEDEQIKIDSPGVEIDTYKIQLLTNMRIALESAHIIFNTADLTTLKGRYALLREQMFALSPYVSTPEYQHLVYQTMEDYKRIYPDKVIQDGELATITAPSQYPLSKVYLKCICGTAARFVQKIKQEIDNLKRQDAKQRRVEQLLAGVSIAQEELTTCCQNEQDYEQAMQAMELLIKEATILKMASVIE